MSRCWKCAELIKPEGNETCWKCGAIQKKIDDDQLQKKPLKSKKSVFYWILIVLICYRFLMLVLLLFNPTAYAEMPLFFLTFANEWRPALVLLMISSGVFAEFVLKKESGKHIESKLSYGGLLLSISDTFIYLNYALGLGWWPMPNSLYSTYIGGIIAFNILLYTVSFILYIIAHKKYGKINIASIICIWIPSILIIIFWSII